MFTTDDLIFDEDGCNVIKVRVDKRCSMATVSFNDKPVLTGNFWDFHPHCYGHDLGQPFQGHDQLAGLLTAICTKRGAYCERRDIETEWDDIECDWKLDPVVFTLMHCGLCRCGASALGVQIEGDGGGLRLTESSLGVWNTVETIEPGDPRYRECIEIMKFEREHGYEPRRPEFQRYLDHLPPLDNLDELEAQWVAKWRDRPLNEMASLEWDSWNRLYNAGVRTHGELASHTQASMVRDLPGVGRSTAMAVARAFGQTRLSWPRLRELVKDSA